MGVAFKEQLLATGVVCITRGQQRNCGLFNVIMMWFSHLRADVLLLSSYFLVCLLLKHGVMRVALFALFHICSVLY